VAPALVPRKHKSGTPRVAVPPNYVGVPLVGWTRQGERGESRGIGLVKSQPPEPRKNGPGARNPAAERRAARVRRSGRPRRQAWTLFGRRSALRSLTSVRGRRDGRRPGAV